MIKLVQINVTANWGSTGKIAEQIGQKVTLKGWQSYIAYGRYCNPSTSNCIKIGSQLDIYKHYFENRVFDNEGLASRRATKKLVDKLRQINPDIIHLHNIHDHYLNYPILFNYLTSIEIPIIWTLHDCWAFTGGCGYYSMVGCVQWKDGCEKCPIPRSKFIDRSDKQYCLRKELFSKVKNLTLIPVSNWLAGEVSQSFLNCHRVRPIPNGIDINTFRPVDSTNVRKKYNIGLRQYAIAVAAVWNARKNLKDYVRLANSYKDINLALVGLTDSQRKNLPLNIIGIPRTQDVHELAALYSGAYAVLNLSLEETFGLTTIEGMACGTPGIVYNCTASPELVTPQTGRIVEQGDIEGIVKAVNELMALDQEMLSKACRQRAVENFNKDERYQEYINLYKEIINKK